MIQRDDLPPTPDWVGCAGNVCSSCLGTANLCRCLLGADGKTCCSGCTHGVEVEPILWTGDQA